MISSDNSLLVRTSFNLSFCCLQVTSKVLMLVSIIMLTKIASVLVTRHYRRAEILTVCTRYQECLTSTQGTLPRLQKKNVIIMNLAPMVEKWVTTYKHVVPDFGSKNLHFSLNWVKTNLCLH